MKKPFVLVVVILCAPAALSRVWTTVYRCDEVTPLEAIDSNQPIVYRDIMVGTRLAIVISSDKSEQWFGGLLLSPEDGEFATLSGRGCRPAVPGIPTECQASCLPAAGKYAYASVYDDLWCTGLYFNTSVVSKGPAVPGDWFIVDYRAERVGTCGIGLYDWFVSADVPISTLHFTHVPSRDFNGDAVVNFQDLALLASHWGAPIDPNTQDAVFDLNSDGCTDFYDLALFSEYWLERTDCSTPAKDPNEPPQNP
jgi:hypothetical protein